MNSTLKRAKRYLTENYHNEECISCHNIFMSSGSVMCFDCYHNIPTDCLENRCDCEEAAEPEFLMTIYSTNTDVRDYMVRNMPSYCEKEATLAHGLNLIVLNLKYHPAKKWKIFLGYMDFEKYHASLKQN